MRTLALLAAALAAPGSAAPAGYRPLENKVCSAGGSLNLLPHLPRIDRSFSPVSNDLGSYNIVTCPGNTTSLACSLATNDFTMAALTASSVPEGSVLQLADSYAMYAAFALALLIIITIGTCVFVCGRYCFCCCCKDEGSCACFRCGAPEPTARGRCRCGVMAVPVTVTLENGRIVKRSGGRRSGGVGGCCSRRRKPVGQHGAGGGAAGAGDDKTSVRPAASTSDDELDAVSASGESVIYFRYFYPKWEVWVLRALMFCFVVCTGAFVIVGAVQGYLGFGTAAEELLGHVTAAVKPLTLSLTGRVDALLLDSLSGVVGPSLGDLSTTVNASIDINAVAGTFSDLVTHVQDLNANTTLAVADGLWYQLTSIRGNLSALGDDVNTLSGVRLNVTYRVGNASAAVTDVKTYLTNSLSPAISATKTSLDATASVVTALKGTNRVSQRYDAVDEALPVLKALSPSGSAGSAMPSTSDINTALGSASSTDQATLFALKAGSNNGVASALTTLADRVVGLNTTLGPILATNYSVVGTDLTTLSNDLTDLGHVKLPALLASVSSLAATVAARPASLSSAPLTALVNGLSSDVDTAVSRLTLASSRLTVLNAQVTALSTAPLIAELDRLTSTAQAVVADVDPLVAQLLRANATLVELPPSIASVLSTIDDVKATITNALGDIAQVKAKVAAANADIAAAQSSVPGYVSTVASAISTVNGSLASFDVSSALTRIGSIDSALVGKVNMSSVTDQLTSVNTSVNAQLDALLDGSNGVSALVTALTAFEANVRAPLASSLPRLSLDLPVLAGGYCSSTTGVSCSASAPCTGTQGVCTAIGVFRCRAVPATPCTTDAGCGAGDTCLGDSGTATDAFNALTGLSTAMPAGPLSAVTNALSSLSTSLGTASSDMSTASGNLATAQTTVTTLDVSALSNGLSTISSSLSSFGASGFDISSVQSTIASVTGAIDAIPYPTYRSQIVDINNQVSGSVMSTMKKAEGAVALAARMITTELPKYAARLTRPALAAIRDARGSGAVLQEVEALYRAAYDDVRLNQTAIELAPLPASPYIPASIVRALTTATATGPATGLFDRGFLFYALSIIEAVSGSAPPVLNATTIGPNPASYVWPGSPWEVATGRHVEGVWYDSAGDTYSGGRLCPTDGCAQVTAHDYAVSKTIGDLAGLVKLTFLDWVHITPLGLLSLTWLIPGVTVLLGLWALLCVPLRCCTSRPRWQKIPASCMTGCILCQLPCLLIALAFAWPAVIALGDVCSSGRGVGYNILLQQAGPEQATSPICRMLGGVGPSDACLVSKTVSFSLSGGAPANVTIATTADLPAYYAALLGGEEMRCATAAAAPWQSALVSVTDQLRTLPVTEVDRIVSSSGTLPVTLGNATRALAHRVATRLGSTTATWLTGTFDSSLSCPALGSLVDNAQDLACCDVAKPVYWSAAGWYWVALFYIFLGLPAGVLGRKRLVGGAWGGYSYPPPPIPSGLAAGDDDARATFERHAGAGEYDTPEAYHNATHGCCGCCWTCGSRRLAVRKAALMSAGQWPPPGYSTCCGCGGGPAARAATPASASAPPSPALGPRPAVALSPSSDGSSTASSFGTGLASPPAPAPRGGGGAVVDSLPVDDRAVALAAPSSAYAPGYALPTGTVSYAGAFVPSAPLVPSAPQAVVMPGAGLGDKTAAVAPGVVSVTGGLTRAPSPVRGPGAGSLMPTMAGATAPPAAATPDPGPRTAGRTGSPPTARPARAPPTAPGARPAGGTADPSGGSIGVGGAVSITGDFRAGAAAGTRRSVSPPRAAPMHVQPAAYATMPYQAYPHAGAAALLYHHAASGLPYATMLPPAHGMGGMSGPGIALTAYPRPSPNPGAGLPPSNLQ